MRASLQRHGLFWALGGFLVTRALVLLVAYAWPPSGTPDTQAVWWSEVPLVRWDSGHYLHIATHGYPPAITDTAAFFPGYPLFVWPFAQVMSAAVALVVASHAAALVAVVSFYFWCRRATDARSAVWAVWTLSCYPPAFFLSAGYADALFLALVALAFILLQRKRPGWAAVLCGMSTAVRPTGLALAAIVVLDALQWPAKNRYRRVWRAAVMGAVSVSGMAAHFGYLGWHYGRADAYFAAQSSWAPKLVERPWNRILTLRPVVQPALEPVKAVLHRQPQRLLEPATWNGAFALALVALGVLGLLRPGPIPRLAFALPVLQFLLAYLDDPVTGARLVGIARYQLAALACFLLVARFVVQRRWERFYLIVLTLSLALQMVYVHGFCSWRMVG